MDYAAARYNMVENQIRTNRVTDPAVIAAMQAIPRERFVPKGLRGIAYLDEDLHIGNNRFLMEPMVLARLLQMAEITPDDAVLDIGCATGYSCAVIASIAKAVVGLECDQALVDEAGKILVELGVDNAAVVRGDPAQGLPEQAPYDLIMLQGSIPEAPRPLLNQLSDGGRLVAVVTRKGIGRATMISRHGDAFSRYEEFDASIPPLPGFVRDEGFVF